ncbi:hypothetical protein CIG19_14790 [Enterobacterales bacterium CwR94]|nr:hypothetical protein CIG19_14790 [Enterobacterales bacterium CwR94]
MMNSISGSTTSSISANLESTMRASKAATSRPLPSAQQMGMISPEQPALDSRLESLEKKAQESEKKAELCNVKMAKRAFYKQVLGVAGAGVAFIAAGLVTGLSGGAAVPFAVLAGCGFGVAVADAWSGWKEYQNQKHGREGLPMADNSVGNGLHWLAKKCNVSDETAMKVATYGSVVTRSALALGTLATALYNPAPAVAALSAVAPAMRMVSTSMGSAQGIMDGSSVLQMIKSQKLKEESLEAKIEHAELKVSDLTQDNKLIKILGDQNQRLSEQDEKNKIEIKNLQANIKVLQEALKNLDGEMSRPVFV